MVLQLAPALMSLRSPDPRIPRKSHSHQPVAHPGSLSAHAHGHIRCLQEAGAATVTLIKTLGRVKGKGGGPARAGSQGKRRVGGQPPDCGLSHSGSVTKQHRGFVATSLGSGARPPLSSCVTLGKSLNHSEPQFPRL